MANKKIKNEEDKEIREEAKKLIDSIIISDEIEKEELKKIFDDMENGELRNLFNRLKRAIEEDKEKIRKI